MKLVHTDFALWRAATQLQSTHELSETFVWHFRSRHILHVYSFGYLLVRDYFFTTFFQGDLKFFLLFLLVMGRLLDFRLPDYFLWCRCCFGGNVGFTLTLQNPVVETIVFQAILYQYLTEKISTVFIFGFLFKLKLLCIFEKLHKLLW